MPRERLDVGFTLLELMITLLVMGALISIAIPNFVRYRGRAARTEAITYLSTLATSEHGHLGEYGTFTDDLTRINVSIAGAPVYLYGFTSDAMPTASAANDTGELAARGGGPSSTEKMVDAFGVLLSESDLPTATAEENEFRLGAVGNVDADGILDRWTIDKSGRLTNVTDDLEGS